MSEPVPQPGLFPVSDLPTELLLIRHGQSAAVVPGEPGSSDPPLSDVGREQARALAARLADRQLDAVYASDLARAVETAEAIVAGRPLPVVQDPDLAEVDLGEWNDGEFRRRAASRDPEWLRFAAAGSWDLVPGGESDAGLRHRVRITIGAIAERHHGQSVAVVCHGGVINAYLAETLGIDRSTFVPIENTSVTVVRTGGARPVVVVMNDATHLYDLVRAGFPT